MNNKQTNKNIEFNKPVFILDVGSLPLIPFRDKFATSSRRRMSKQLS